MKRLAVTYAGISRYSKAIELLEEVLKLRTKLLGDGDPATLSDMRDMLDTWKLELLASGQLVPGADPAELQRLQRLSKKLPNRSKFSWFASRIVFLIVPLAVMYQAYLRWLG
jgi:hypothetical protein